jgi:MarR family transcriptional regulator, 2-MHQ and catechol-resistance regulon repressor
MTNHQLPLAVFVKLMRAADTVASNVHRHLQGQGLTPSQFGVLEALLHLGPLHQRQIGRKILKSHGNVSTVLDNLEKQGWVVRRRQTEDRRFVKVDLSESGRALISRLFPCHAAAIAEELSVLSTEEQLELARLCRKLGLKGSA